MKSLKSINAAVIGAGKIAHSLIPALTGSGFKVSMIISRNAESAARLAKKHSVKKHSSSLSILKELKGIIFLSVPDKEIKELAVRLSKQRLRFNELLFVHLSGSFDLSVLSDLHGKGSGTGSIHILQSFPSKSVKKLKGSYCAIEASSLDWSKELKTMCNKLGTIPFEIKKEDKVLYHVAAVFASNFINSVLYGSSLLFNEIKGINKNHLRMFENIINTTIDNIRKLGPAEALSGPIERGDFNTIKLHLKELKKQDLSIYASYVSLSLLLIKAADEKYSDDQSRDPSERMKIRKLLEKELQKIAP